MGIHGEGVGRVKTVLRFPVCRAVAVLLLALVLCASARGADFTGKVVSVADGDTITVMRDDVKVILRLNGIDCPELGQPYGDRAKLFTSALAIDETVTVKVFDTDKYGRLVADVILSDGRVVNQELVKAGFAWWYKEYSKDKALEQLEADARTAKRALWQDPKAVAPWDWRHKTGPAAGTTNRPTETVKAKPAGEETKEVTVYVTKTGTKYHVLGCRYLKSSIPMTLIEAAKRYTPCSACRPPVPEEKKTE